MHSDVVVVETEELLHELEVGVAEVGLVVHELQVLFLNSLMGELRNKTRPLQGFCSCKQPINIISMSAHTLPL